MTFFYFLGKALYDVRMVDWAIWTNKIKKPFIKSIFKEYQTVGKEVYPTQPQVRLKIISYALEFDSVKSKQF